MPRNGSHSTLCCPLLAGQPQASAVLEVQHAASADPRNTLFNLEGLGSAEQLAAVVPQGGGRGRLPTAESRLPRTVTSPGPCNWPGSD